MHCHTFSFVIFYIFPAQQTTSGIGLFRVLFVPLPFSLFMASTSIDVQNEREENTHTHTHSIIDPPLGGSTRVA